MTHSLFRRSVAAVVAAAMLGAPAIPAWKAYSARPPWAVGFVKRLMILKNSITASR
jgi:hypothetical protein